MDPRVAALLAGVIAWLSILLVIRLPGGAFDAVALRRVGAATVAVLGLQIMGVPMPAASPVLILLGGAIAVYQPRGSAAA